MQDASKDDRLSAPESFGESGKGWESAFNAIEDIVLIMDTSLKVLWANTAALREMEISGRKLIGTRCPAFWENAGPHAACPVEQVLKTGRPHSGRIRLEGTGKTYVITVSPVFGENGKVHHLIHMAKDITAPLRMEDNLMRAQKMEAIGTLAGGLSHDFNNLLQVILGNAQLLKRKLPESEAGRELDAIIQAVRRGGDITRQLLTVSRRITSERKPMMLNPEIEEIFELLQGTLPKNISMELSLDPDLRLINGDAAQISQILVNLAVNAAHAMPSGGNLVIETKNAELDKTYAEAHTGLRPGSYVMLAVSDTGEGIPPEIRSHIFEPFFTTKDSELGTGLGLAMVYAIVKNHEGTVSCYSEPGVGTAFKIYFPAAGETAVAASTVGEAAWTGGKGETILLVDDERAIRHLGERMLNLAGYKVLMAANGHEALEVFRKHRAGISLVLLDLNMPVMNGEDCLNALRQMDSKIPVVIATGFSLSHERREKVLAQCSAFISKPYHVNELLKELRTALDKVQR